MINEISPLLDSKELKSIREVAMILHSLYTFLGMILQAGPLFTIISTREDFEVRFVQIHLILKRTWNPLLIV